MSVVNSELKKDSFGKIQLLSGIQEKKDKVQLYLRTQYKDIPFSSYGNTLINQIFNVLDEDLADDLKEELIKNISDKFQLEILKYSYIIDKDQRKITIHIYLLDETVLELNVEG